MKRFISSILLIAVLLMPTGAALAIDLPLRIESMQTVGNGIPVLMPGAVVQGKADAAPKNEKKVRRGIVLCDTSVVSLPEENAPVIMTAAIGQSFDVYAVHVNGKWDAVMLPENGTMAYIRSNLLSVSAPTFSAADPGVTDGGESGYPGEIYNDESYLALMSEATKYIGMPYVFGGSTPKTSFDCSGYVCWVLNHSGRYETERTDAQGLYNMCKEVEKEDAQPGDLLFFQGTYDTTNAVTHVAFYVGNGYMLHCGKPIGYSRIDTQYWQEHFYAFGRLA
ncbi:MAG: C40 family peptidase [Christensenella sp.]